MLKTSCVIFVVCLAKVLIIGFRWIAIETEADRAARDQTHIIYGGRRRTMLSSGIIMAETKWKAFVQQKERKILLNNCKHGRPKKIQKIEQKINKNVKKRIQIKIK